MYSKGYQPSDSLLTAIKLGLGASSSGKARAFCALFP